MAMLALALAGSAFAATKTESISLGDAKSRYLPIVGGSSLGSSNITLGNDYYMRSMYLTDNIYEMDISAFDFASIDTVEIASSSGFFDLSGSQPLDENLKAIKISFYEGGTGNASSDWIDSKLTLVKEISGLSKKEIENGITINDLGFGSDDILTFVISIDNSLIPEMPTEGEGIGFGHNPYGFELTLTGTAVPEPAEWAAIFGAIALGAAVYRRRK